MRRIHMFAVVTLLGAAGLSGISAGQAAAAGGCGDQLADWGPAAGTAHYTGVNQTFGSIAIDLTRASDITVTVTQGGFVTAVNYPIAVASISGSTLTATISGDQLTMTATDCNSGGKVVAANARQEISTSGGSQTLWQGKIAR